MTSNGGGGVHALPPPASPSPPDFSFCHPFYGRNLIRSECEAAANLLPAGSVPQQIVTASNPYGFPIIRESGSCKITVAWNNPDSEDHNAPTVALDSFRQMTNWLVSSCVTVNRLGGFATLGLQHAINWIADPTTPEAVIRNGPMPGSATYFSVTIERTDQGSFMHAGLDDPAIAAALSDGVRIMGNRERANALALTFYGMDRSYNQGGQTSWWDGFSSLGGTSSLSEMVYSCDSQLGNPSAVDCSQLAYSGLGPPSDTFTVGSGSLTKILSSGTCHVAVEAVTTIALTWAQISAGLNTLVNSCVMHPLVRARGGRAFYGKPKSSRVRRRAAPVNGLDALPPGVSLTLCDASKCPKGI